MATPRSSSRTPDQIGRVLGGRYRLTGLVGTGASAHVFVAEDVTLRRIVAVKTLHPALADDEAFLRRFRAEARAAAALNHPHIMRVFDWGEADDGPYLVLEHLVGGSLRDLLDAGHRLSPSQALMIGLEAASALDYAHRRGLVHRDVKPANLLFDEEGRLCVADFGLARALAESAWTEPDGVVLGTARYASPEQVQGSAVDGRADVYALALVLVEAVTGQVPFAADTTIATLMARLHQPLNAPAAMGALGPALERAAAPDREDRFDAAGLARALDAAAAQLPRPAPIPVGWGAEAQAAPPFGPAPEPGTDLTELGTAYRATRPAAPPAGPTYATTTLAPQIATATSPVTPPRRRRWPRRLFISLATLVLAGAVAAGALVAFTLTRPRYPVPTLVGLTQDKAAAALAAEHLHLRLAGQRYDELVPAGVIVDQSPAASHRARKGTSVAVHVSEGPQPRAVPDLTGLSLAAATSKLQDAGFTVGEADTFSDAVAKGFVVSWSPKDGPQAKGAKVVITLSSGYQPLPDVTQMTPEQAATALTNAGYTPATAQQFSDTVPSGQILNTAPPAGAPTQHGTTVTINVSKGPDTTTVPPGVIGVSVDQATALLQQAGLQLGQVFGPSKHGQVFYSDPNPGTKVKRQSQINLYTF